jgi:hypothetical protein
MMFSVEAQCECFHVHTHFSQLLQFRQLMETLRKTNRFGAAVLVRPLPAELGLDLTGEKFGRNIKLMETSGLMSCFDAFDPFAKSHRCTAK